MKTRHVLITGGTGSVGRALVHAFAQAGDSVTFVYLNDQHTAAELMRIKGVVGLRINLAEQPRLDSADFDVLINNAGVSITSTLSHEIPDSEFESTLSVNLRAPFYLARSCLPSMMAKGWGRIVNVGSIYSLVGTARNASYNISKHALTGLTRSLAKDYAAFGITANEVCPSAVDSDLMHEIAQRAVEQGRASDAEEYLDAVRVSNPSGRMASVSDVVTAVRFLASEEASFVNGVSLTVDGGQIC